MEHGTNETIRKVKLPFAGGGFDPLQTIHPISAELDETSEFGNLRQSPAHHELRPIRPMSVLLGWRPSLLGWRSLPVAH